MSWYAAAVERGDFELLDAWHAGDTAAANALFDRYFRQLYLFFRTKVDDGAAEDLVQQTLLACVQNVKGFRGDASFRTYVFRAARSRLYNFFDARRRREAVFDPGATSCVELGVEPSFARGTREDQLLLLQALRGIPLELQLALELYYFERMRAPELALVLELPEGTVRSRLRRGIELLRERVAALASGAAELESTMSNLDDWAAQIHEVVLADRPAAAKR
jgi:RNA polymerase sigma factor (sigma-70 family)